MIRQYYLPNSQREPEPKEFSAGKKADRITGAKLLHCTFKESPILAHSAILRHPLNEEAREGLCTVGRKDSEPYTFIQGHPQSINQSPPTRVLYRTHTTAIIIIALSFTFSIPYNTWELPGKCCCYPILYNIHPTQHRAVPEQI